MTTARKRILDPHTNEQRSPLEMLAMLLVSGSYRVPVEGRSTRDALRAHDVAAAIGMVRNRRGKQVALTVVRQAGPVEIAKIARLAYRPTVAKLLLQAGWLLDLREPADRWRLRLVLYDAAHELVWPERRQPYRALAKSAKMRVATYRKVHRVATAVLHEAMCEAAAELRQRLFAEHYRAL